MKVYNKCSVYSTYNMRLFYICGYRADILKGFWSFKLRLNLEPGQLGVCKTGFAEVLSYKNLSTKNNTELECTGKLQAFKKAPSLMGLGIQAQLSWKPANVHM